MQIIALVIIIVLALIYTYINFLFLPKWTSIQKQREQLQKRQAYYQQLLGYQSNPAGLKKTSDGLEDQAKDLTAQIPSQLDKPQIMVDIYTIAKLHSINPQTLKFEPLQNKGDHQELTMNFSCSGNTEDVLSLIEDLEHTPLQKFALQSINLTRSKASSGTDKTSIDTTLQTILSGTKTVSGDLSTKTAITGEVNQSNIMTSNPVDSSNPASLLGTNNNTSPGLINPKPQLNVELKFVAYSSPIGTADRTDKKPAFMFSQFGSDSIAKMFEP